MSIYRTFLTKTFRLCGHPTLGKLFICGLSNLVLSFSLYFFQRITGLLPDQITWFRQANHGPWDMRLEGILVCFPYVFVFIPLTFIIGITLIIKTRRLVLLLHTFTLASAFALMLNLQWTYLRWLID
jgi:hypothetical protein